MSPYEGEVANKEELPICDKDVLSKPLEELGLDLDAINNPLNDYPCFQQFDKSRDSINGNPVA